VAKPIAVPFTRVLKLGTRGPDVKAVKRALCHQGCLKQRLRLVTPIFGLMVGQALQRFQGNHGLAVTGNYTEETHAKLVAGRHFDSFGAHLMASFSKGGKGEKLRKKISAAALYAHAHAPRHYTQGGQRMEGVVKKVKPPKMWSFADCSAFATWCYWVAGAPDPNGLGYNGQGWTGTQVDHGKVVKDPKPGDLVFYGPGPNRTHVAVFVGNGKVVGHGQEGGPFLEVMDYRSDRGEIRRYV